MRQDVYPDGAAYNIAEGIVRSVSGACEVDMLGTANVFLPGHAIRVDVTNANFPQFARAEEASANTVGWGSFITLPVVPVPEGINSDALWEV